MRYLLLFLLLTTCFRAAAQSDSSVRTGSTRPFVRRYGSPLALVVAEGVLSGFAWYASKPAVSGDKVVGGLFAGCAAGMAVATPLEFFGKRRPGDSLRGQRIGNAIAMTGMSYGFYRIARYNLAQAGGASSSARFGRNLLEMNAAYFVPIFSGLLVDRWWQRHHNRRVVPAAFSFNGRQLYLALRFP